MSDPAPPPSVEGLAILAVDDDPAIRALVEANFVRRGARLTLAATPESALAACEITAFDAVILDLMLPGRSGLELLPELRSRAPGAPVIILTAHGSVDLAVQCLQAGAWTFLQKPFRGAHLVTTVGQAVDASRVRAELLKAEDRANQAERLLRALQRERELEAQLVRHYRLASLGSLAAGVVQEIQSPITFVRANLDTLARHANVLERALRRELLELSSGTSADEVLDALEDLRVCIADSLSGADRVLDIVQAVKRSARPGQGAPQLTDLAELARAATVLVRTRFMGSLALHLELASAPVRCDGSPISQAILNLLANAADALSRKGGGSAWVRSGVEKGRAFVEVADDGPGIGAEDMPELFTRFFTRGTGAGLGLSISRELVEDQGGTLVVASRMGGGAAFRLEMPSETGAS